MTQQKKSLERITCGKNDTGTGGTTHKAVTILINSTNKCQSQQP